MEASKFDVKYRKETEKKSFEHSNHISIGDSKTLKPGIYLEEALKDVLRTSNFVHGMFNLIAAPCGSGKTTAAINVISKLASSPRTAIYLIDTTNGMHRLARLKELTLVWLSI